MPSLQRLTAAFILFAAGPVAAQTTTRYSDWPKYCANLAMSGVAQSAGSLTSDNAPFLRPIWTTKLGGPIASSPTIANDRLYIGDWSGHEWLIDAPTGKIIAGADLGTTVAPQCEPPMLGITSAPAVDGDTIYLAGGDDAFYALDAHSLDVIWCRILGDSSANGGYYGWCSPTVVENSVLQGVSSNCDNPFVPGRVVAFASGDGTIVDDAYLVTEDFPHNFSGSGVWTSPAVDMGSRSVFVTTASAYDYEDGHSYSIVRLSLDDLTIEDWWKIPPSDVVDADWGSSPTLFTDNQGRELVGAGQKDGQYYAFLRDDLASGPVWTAQIAVGGPCPQCADGVLSTAAFDGRRLYVGGGRPTSEDHEFLGSVSAVDPTTGQFLWRHYLAEPAIAPISYANGVVFTTSGSQAVAFNADTGEMLWSFATLGQCFGGVAITDLGIFFGDLAGNLYAFAPGTARATQRTRPSRR